MVRFIIRDYSLQPLGLTAAGETFLREAWVDSHKTVTGICAQMGIGDMQILYKFAKGLKLGNKITLSSYTKAEDDIIKTGWPDPDRTCEQMAEEITRSVVAIRARASRLKLGQKAKHLKVARNLIDAKSWPADMHFEDHPAANDEPKYDDHHKIAFDF